LPYIKNRQFLPRSPVCPGTDETFGVCGKPKTPIQPIQGGNMDQIEPVASQSAPMTMGGGIVRYLVCFGIFIALCFIVAFGKSDALTSLGLMAYLACGVYLNRVVLRRVIEWHPMYNTLDNVTSGKLWYFFAWPFMYAVLFVKLGIDKVL
jgi:hypothetical protein